MRYTYIKYNPRGFANTMQLYVFKNKAAAQNWLEHECPIRDAASIITADEARYIKNYKGDAMTQNFTAVHYVPAAVLVFVSALIANGTIF